MDWLKDLLKDYVEEGKVDEVVEKFNKENPKYFMPKNTFNEKSEELRLAKEQIEENKKLLDDLSKKASTVEDYEKNLNDYKEKYEQLEQDSNKRISEITKKTQFKEQLINSGVHKDAVDLILNAQNMEELLLEGEKITNSDEIIGKHKEQRPGLFFTKTEDSAIKDEHKETSGQGDPDLRKLFGLPDKQ